MFAKYGQGNSWRDHLYGSCDGNSEAQQCFKIQCNAGSGGAMDSSILVSMRMT